MRYGFTLALVVVLVVAPLGAPLAAADSQGESPREATAANHTVPPDPEEDVIGWENGYWYNESIDVDQADGLNDTELSKVVNRSMARVEHVRELEFQQTVPVNVTSREAYAESISGGYQNVSEEARLHFRMRYESRFFVPEDEDPIAVTQTARVAGVGGFYVPALDRITVISENTTAPKLDEITLAQELFHALQDQVFPEFRDRELFNPYRNGTFTLEDHNTYDAVIEGDGNYVDSLYQQRCEEEWDCLLPDESSGGGGSDINLGILLTQLVPYSDGPPFVKSIHQEGGWEAVNDLYENPPSSTEQLIHPAKYPDETPTDVTVTDESDGEWRPLERANDSVGIGLVQTSSANMTFGEGGIFAMFWFASAQNLGEEVVIPYDIFDQPGIDLYDLDSETSAGWDGDLLVPYVNDSSARTNETAYVWRTVWDSPENAEEFRDGYYELLEFYGGERVGASENTWRIPDDRQFGDAFHVVTEGDTVLIVNAPTVEELGEVRTDIDLSAAMRTPSPTATTSEEPTPTPTETSPAETATTGSMNDGGTDETTTEPMTEETADGTVTDAEETTRSPGQPGVGTFGAALAVVIAVLLSRRID